jgi:hypothetical protein
VFLLEVDHPLKICQHEKFRRLTLIDAIFAHLRILKFPPWPYSKAPSKKIVIQIQLVLTSAILTCTKPSLVSLQRFINYLHKNVKFKFRLLVMIIFFANMALLKVVHSLKNYQHTKFHGPTLSGASLVPTSEVWTPDILQSLKMWN